VATAQYEGNRYLIIKGESSVAGSYSLWISGVSRSITRDVQRGLRPGLFRLRFLGSFRGVNAETIAEAFATGVECFLQLESGNRVDVLRKKRELFGKCQAQTVSVGGSPPGVNKVSCARSVPKPYLFSVLGIALSACHPLGVVV